MNLKDGVKCRHYAAVRRGRVPILVPFGSSYSDMRRHLVPSSPDLPCGGWKAGVR